MDLKLGISEDEVDKMLDDLGSADSKGYVIFFDVLCRLDFFDFGICCCREDEGQSEMAWVLQYLETAEPVPHTPFAIHSYVCMFLYCVSGNWVLWLQQLLA